MTMQGEFTLHVRTKFYGKQLMDSRGLMPDIDSPKITEGNNKLANRMLPRPSVGLFREKDSVSLAFPVFLCAFRFGACQSSIHH
jgi:hypothetical protein